MPCNSFECDLKKICTIAVYESMNKGSGGGFDQERGKNALKIKKCLY